MTDAKEENENFLPDEVRLTKFGKVLHSTSLDELSELLNMLKGERGIIEATEKSIDFSRIVAG